MIKAKKKFGQNFLTDTSIIKEIINHINPKEKDRILEIGPGMGALTKPILSKISHIDVIEIDSDMVAHLNKTVAESQISIMQDDILLMSKEALRSFDRIIGNLPYYISTEIMIKMIDLIDDFNEKVENDENDNTFQEIETSDLVMKIDDLKDYVEDYSN
jgi:16S rRNA (adenine1518-N6/adenine1519-N6)-dimethyltransferase